MADLFTHHISPSDTLEAPKSPTSTTADISSVDTKEMPDPPFMLSSPIMMVTRDFDIRRVYNSKKALRLSMDVANVRPDTLVAFVKHSGNPETLPYVIVAGTVIAKNMVYCRKLQLASECIDLDLIEAKLSNGVLEIMAPKTLDKSSRKVTYGSSYCGGPLCEEINIERFC